jgi:hypothetical protein
MGESPRGAGKLVCVVLRVFYLFPDRREKSPDCDLAGSIGNEHRNGAAAVTVDAICGAGLIGAFRFQQPPAFAQLNSQHTSLFGRTELVRCFPLIEINEPAPSGPRLLADAEGVIAIAAEVWTRRNSLSTHVPPASSATVFAVASPQRTFRKGHPLGGRFTD